MAKRHTAFQVLRDLLRLARVGPVPSGKEIQTEHTPTRSWQKPARSLALTAAIGIGVTYLGWLSWTVVQLYREGGEIKRDHDALRSELKTAIDNLSQQEAKDHDALENRLERLDRRVDGVAARGLTPSRAPEP